jgi:hypothetical protein
MELLGSLHKQIGPIGYPKNRISERRIVNSEKSSLKTEL